MSEAVTTIALDAMGGDHGPSVVVPAALHALRKNTALRIVLVGDQQVVSDELRRQQGEVGERLSIHHASQVVGMDELPSSALRNKKDSSMRVAINLVKSGEADACVSAGNTGALMATARFVLKTLPGIDRPAIISALPTMQGHTRMLDLGANIDCSAEQLYQFAVMGSVLTCAVDNIERPSIGLLNIGEEEIKGNEQVKEAAKLLKDSPLNYIGYVEGDDIYKGKSNVVVCDGFLGNVSLKSSEGLAKMIITFLREKFTGSFYGRIAGLIALPILRAMRHRFDHRVYNGASLVGLRGIVIKSHGNADEFAYGNAIHEAILEVKKNVPERIREQLGHILEERRAV